MSTSTNGTAPGSSGPVDGPPALHVDAITSGYDGTTILRSVSLTVPTSSVVALLGPNGAGKTTLLNTISGVIKPSSGSIQMAGVDVTKLAPYKRTTRGLCHIPEGRGVFRSLTVRENIVMQSEVGHEAEALERAADAFPILGERLAQQAGTLSGGQQQMLAMARAYVRSPNLILVDEASLGLAPVVVDDIFAFLAGVAASGAALLIVDQFVARALEMSDFVYVMRHGEIVRSARAADMQGDEVFADYMGSADGIVH